MVNFEPVSLHSRISLFPRKITESLGRWRHLSQSLHLNNTIDHPHCRRQADIPRRVALPNSHKCRVPPPQGLWILLVVGGGTWLESFDEPIALDTLIAL